MKMSARILHKSWDGIMPTYSIKERGSKVRLRVTHPNINLSKNRVERRFDTVQEARAAWNVLRRNGYSENENTRLTLNTLIEKRFDEIQDKDGKNTSFYNLRKIHQTLILEKPLTSIDSSDFYELADVLLEKRSPSTVLSYLSSLSGALDVIDLKYGYSDTPTRALRAVILDLKTEGDVHESIPRDRRPSKKEINDILHYMLDRYLANAHAKPHFLAVYFALFSARRLSEICKLKVTDLDLDHKVMNIIPAKQKGIYKKRRQKLKIPQKALKLLKHMPLDREKVFDTSYQKLSNQFREACVALDIENLRFHDLRHEAISYCFEQGMNVAEVMTVSGHKNLENLSRYTHFENSNDKYANFPFDKVLYDYLS